MKKTLVLLCLLQISIINYGQIIVDHNCTNLQGIPVSYIDQTRVSLHIAYEHTSHGSQIIDGMTGLYNWKGNTYNWNNGGLNGGLDIHDHGITGDSDLGAPDWTSWAASTRSYLKNSSNSDVNVVMWAWCGQVSSASESNINTYLNLMNSLESEFPKVKFVYMTGHLDGTGVNGTLNIRNQQIRNYCRNNNKILYDFADIESYDPDGSYYLDKCANDNCDYDSNNDGSPDRNWATVWQNSHTLNVDWYNCSSAHSQPLNANLKAYAAWWLFARLAGWAGPSLTIQVSGIAVTGNGGEFTITTNTGTLQLNASILPSNATNQAVKWSIANGTGQATISSAGLVTAVSNGTVTAMATADDGSGVSGTITLTISNQLIPVTGITVTGDGGISSITSDDGTLQLNALVIPSNASNKSVTWSIAEGTGRASVSMTGLVTAITDGTVTAVATSSDGSAISGIIEITISNQIIPVSGITVIVEGGSNIITSDKGSLQLTTQILPEIATNKNVSWSVVNITGQATISPTGLVTAIDEGTVAATATATDGTGVNGTIEIAIKSKKNEPLYAIITGNEIRIPLDGIYSGSKVSLLDLNGILISSKPAKDTICTFEASALKPGIYVIVLSNSVILRVGKFILPR